MKINEKVTLGLAVLAFVVAVATLVSSVSLETASQNSSTWGVLLWVALKWLAYTVSIAFLTWWMTKRRMQLKSVASLDAYAYVHPTDPEIILVRWQVPEGVTEASLILDFKPVGQPMIRKRLISNSSVTPGETVKTELCSRRNESWRWATAEGEIMHKDALTCRLLVLSEGKTVSSWQFAIPGRHFKDRPHIVGENLFNAPLS